MKTFQIGDVPVGQGHKPLIIAEMSGNHNQSLDRALDIVDAAAKTGVQMIKLQTYTADTMTLDLDHDEFFISDPNSLWAGSSLYDLYKVACTPWEWHEAIFQRAKDLGLMCISTPFDESAVDFLEELNAPAYKIASFEITDIPLIEYVASKGKPVILSTGIASLEDIELATRLESNSSLSGVNYTYSLLFREKISKRLTLHATYISSQKYDLVSTNTQTLSTYSLSNQYGGDQEEIDLGTMNLDKTEITVPKFQTLGLGIGAVSYTHLTLPTNREV